MITRRQFFGCVAGAALYAGAPGTPGFPAAFEREGLVPGEVVRFFWPLSRSGIRVLVRRDGREVGEAPLVRDGGRWPWTLAFCAVPPAPIRAGRYEFVLDARGISISFGGYRIADYRFGY